MAGASASIDFPASTDQVWQLIGGFNSLLEWPPYIPKSEASEGDQVRHIANPNGETIVEGLEAFDNVGNSYSILQVPFPVECTGSCRSFLCV